jgi:hypothetical protein
VDDVQALSCSNRVYGSWNRITPLLKTGEFITSCSLSEKSLFEKASGAAQDDSATREV